MKISSGKWLKKTGLLHPIRCELWPQRGGGEMGHFTSTVHVANLYTLSCTCGAWSNPDLVG